LAPAQQSQLGAFLDFQLRRLLRHYMAGQQGAAGAGGRCADRGLDDIAPGKLPHADTSSRRLSAVILWPARTETGPVRANSKLDPGTSVDGRSVRGAAGFLFKAAVSVPRAGVDRRG